MSALHICLAILSALIWGCSFAAIRFSVLEIPPLLFCGLRFLGTGLLLIPFAARPTGRKRDLLSFALVFGLGHFALLFIGLQSTEASLGAAIQQSSVPFASLLAVLLLKDSLNLRQYLGMFVAFAGVCVLFWDPQAVLNFWGPFWLLASSFMWGMGNIQVKKLEALDAITINAYMSLYTAPFMFLLSFLLEESHGTAMTTASWGAWVGLGYNIFIAGILSYIIWYFLLGRYNVNQVVPYSLLTPVFGVLAGMLFLGELLSWQKILGGSLVMLGVMAVIFHKRGVVSSGKILLEGSQKQI